MNTPVRKVDPAVWFVAIGMVLLFLALAVLPNISSESERTRAREIRVCEMAKVMAGETDAAGARLLCARDGWER